MSLNYTEANMFVRAGDDMRRAAFAPSAFVRLREGELQMHHAGGTWTTYTPTRQDRKATDWSRA